LTKVLGQAGTSLADIYDVEGSIVGVEQINAQDVSAVHELGACINSERMGLSILRLSTGSLTQTITFDITVPLADMIGITRILGIFVFADGDRVLTANVNMINENGQDEICLWWWDPSTDLALAGRVLVLGSVGSRTILRPSSLLGNVPTLSAGPGQRAQVGGISLRGITTTFGAGTVEITAHVLIATADVTGTGVGAPSNKGLPLASW